MNKRIIGIDVARALAVIGMIIVNFKIVFGNEGMEITKFLTSIFKGKAAATFVVLAGIGIAFMSNSAIVNNDIQKLKRIRAKLLKRAVFLFIVGLTYIPIWPADILHFYGLYMVVTLFLIKSSQRIILAIALTVIFIFPFLMLIWDYELGWNFELLEYSGFWTVNGFVRNLFYNGFHPVIPWMAFMLIGFWFGRQNLNSDSFLRKAMWVSLVIFILTRLSSLLLISFLSEGDLAVANELKQIFGTSPMPPLPVYMISGSSIAIFLISVCIVISKRFKNNIIISALNKTGQLALTFYVAHVILGMGILEILNPEKIGAYTIEFSLAYALLFSFLCVVFAVIWRRYNSSGPLEWTMRKLVG